MGRPSGSELSTLISTAQKRSRETEAKWARARAKLRRIQAKEGDRSYAYWRQILEIVDQKLYLGGGMRSVRAFLAQELPNEPRRSFDRRLMLARVFDERAWKEHDASWLEQVALIAKERGSTEIPLDPSRVWVQIEERGGTKRKRATDCSVAELRRARARTPEDPLVATIADAVEREAELEGVTVRSRGERLDFRGVEKSALGRFAEVLARAARRS